VLGGLNVSPHLNLGSANTAQKPLSNEMAGNEAGWPPAHFLRKTPPKSRCSHGVF